MKASIVNQQQLQPNFVTHPCTQSSKSSHSLFTTGAGASTRLPNHNAANSSSLGKKAISKIFVKSSAECYWQRVSSQSSSNKCLKIYFADYRRLYPVFQQLKGLDCSRSRQGHHSNTI